MRRVRVTKEKLYSEERVGASIIKKVVVGHLTNI
jgi:hypothetical protein